MKKRSEQKASGRKPHSLPVFFIDRSLGKRVVADELSAEGVRVEKHDDHFPQDATDEEWLAECGNQGWVVLTRDKRIRYRPSELEALKAARVSAVFLTGKDARGVDFAKAILKALPKLEQLFHERTDPVIVRVTRDGIVTEFDLG